MNPDQKFFAFITGWAKDRNCIFIPQACDGRESPDLVEGMAVDDVWGWLLPEGVTKKDNEHFGCIEWSVKNGKLQLEWNDYES